MRSPRTRYGMIYGVPTTTNSRVPRMRPVRPIAGFSASRSTVRTMAEATSRGAVRAVVGDVVSKSNEMFDRLGCPRDLHSGGGCSLPVPQDRNHSATRAWSMDWPASASSIASRISRRCHASPSTKAAIASAASVASDDRSRCAIAARRRRVRGSICTVRDSLMPPCYRDTDAIARAAEHRNPRANDPSPGGISQSGLQPASRSAHQ